MALSKHPYLFLPVTLLMGASLAAADDNAVDLHVGEAAPQFVTQDDEGRVWDSSDYIGKQIVVLYFYPADMTPGCTKQACGFRDDMNKLTESGIKVVGVSGDSVRNHQLFKKAHDLNFTLVTDVDGSIAKLYGVPHGRRASTVKAFIDGQDELLTRLVTTQRWTFVIDKSGDVALKNTEVKAAEDSKAIQNFVDNLK